MAEKPYGRQKLDESVRQLGYRDYNDYLASPHWEAMKQRQPRKYCAWCHKRSDLVLHHQTYKRLGNERVEDLAWLCQLHHRALHRRKRLSLAVYPGKAKPGELRRKHRTPRSKVRVSADLEKAAQEAGFPDYVAYLLSPSWRTQRREALTRDKWRCVRCQSRQNLQVHHVQYASPLGNEPLDWLETLCDRCHRLQHKRPTRKRVPNSSLNSKKRKAADKRRLRKERKQRAQKNGQPAYIAPTIRRRNEAVRSLAARGSPMPSSPKNSKSA